MPIIITQKLIFPIRRLKAFHATLHYCWSQSGLNVYKVQKPKSIEQQTSNISNHQIILFAANADVWWCIAASLGITVALTLPPSLPSASTYLLHHTETH